MSGTAAHSSYPSWLTGRAGAATSLVAAGLVGTALVLRDPHQQGSWLVCPLYATTGVYCPGCGTLRGLNDLLTGHVGAAVGSNALLLPALVWLAWAWLSAARVGIGGWRVSPAPTSARFCYVLLAVLAVFTIARNLPGSPLAP